MKAIQEGRWGKVHALEYLLTHSFSGRAAAILRVTTNPGANTRGVDGDIWNTPEAKTAAFSRLGHADWLFQIAQGVLCSLSSFDFK